MFYLWYNIAISKNKEEWLLWKKYTEQELIEMDETKRFQLYMYQTTVLKNSDDLSMQEAKTILENLQPIEKIEGIRQ